MSDLDISKYPVNAKGFTVIPCVQLSFERMEDWMVGFKVTVGLEQLGIATYPAEIVGYDEKRIHLKVGGKTKKLDYNPSDIQLQCYQFDKRIMFSNESWGQKVDGTVDLDN